MTLPTRIRIALALGFGIASFVFVSWQLLGGAHSADPLPNSPEPRIDSRLSSDRDTEHVINQLVTKFDDSWEAADKPLPNVDDLRAATKEVLVCMALGDFERYQRRASVCGGTLGARAQAILMRHRGERRPGDGNLPDIDREGVRKLFAGEIGSIAAWSDIGVRDAAASVGSADIDVPAGMTISGMMSIFDYPRFGELSRGMNDGSVPTTAIHFPVRAEGFGNARLVIQFVYSAESDCWIPLRYHTVSSGRHPEFLI